MKAHAKLPHDLLIILAWVILTLVFVITPVLEGTFLRTILGLPMVLFIPGYVLIAALFPKKADMEAAERIVLSFGLSIAVVPLLGLLLNFTFGIKLLPILLTLCSYTIALALIAAYMRIKLPENERFSVQFHRIYDFVNSEIKAPRGRTDLILTWMLIFSIFIAAGMIYFVITTPKIGEKFTEFYILGASGRAENYPNDLKYNVPAKILVGVVNHEHAAVNYTVEVALDKNVLSNTRLSLGHNETWENNITLVPNKEGNDQKLEFWLFKDTNFTVPYRSLYLWVNVTK